MVVASCMHPNHRSAPQTQACALTWGQNCNIFRHRMMLQPTELPTPPPSHNPGNKKFGTGAANFLESETPNACDITSVTLHGSEQVPRPAQSRGEGNGPHLLMEGAAAEFMAFCIRPRPFHLQMGTQSWPVCGETDTPLHPSPRPHGRSFCNCSQNHKPSDTAKPLTPRGNVVFARNGTGTKCFFSPLFLFSFLYFFSKYIIFILFLERGEGREKEKVRNIHA